MNGQSKIDAKIGEAKYFLKRMRVVASDQTVFGYYLSAFLSAARSALQYVCKEASGNGGQKWHDDQIAKSNLACFFKNQRDINIHKDPVSPQGTIGLEVEDTIKLPTLKVFDVVEIGIGDKAYHYKIEHVEEEPLEASPSSKESKASANYGYFFNGWSGNEDVFELCESYLKVIEAIVSDGVTRKFLTL